MSLFTSVEQLMCFHSLVTDYTVWRKNNACFSSNCNFVYFQYKQIMLTPKQPLINALLITYIDYSITENYIGKMVSFLTHVRSLSSNFCITFTNIFCGTVAISSRMETFKSSTVPGFRTETFDLR